MTLVCISIAILTLLTLGLIIIYGYKYYKNKVVTLGFDPTEEWVNTFDSIPDLIMILDVEHTVIKANKAVMRTLKLTKEEIIGKKCYDLMHNSTEPPLFCPYRLLLRDGIIKSTEVTALGRNYLVSVDPIYHDSELIGVVHVSRDITELKNTQQELDDKSQEIYQLNIAKTSDLLDSARALNSGIAHELRTPMQAITNIAELIEVELEELLGMGVIKVSHLELIQDLLDDIRGRIKYSVLVLNSLSAYAKSGAKADVDLVEVNEELGVVIKTLRFTDYFKHLSVEDFILLSNCNKAYIAINRTEFRQIIENLCRNSVEASRTGVPIKIEIRVDYSEKEVLIKIIDNGVGIPEEFQNDIFKPYFSTKAVKKEHNQGLGLAIVKNIIIKYGGKIDLNSTVGRTEFILRFKKAKGD